MATKFKKGDVIQVDWGDAWSQAGWATYSDKTCKPKYVTNVGAFLLQNKNGILMSIAICDGDPGGCFFVPRGMIVKTKLLVPTKRIKTSY